MYLFLLFWYLRWYCQSPDGKTAKVLARIKAAALNWSSPCARSRKNIIDEALNITNFINNTKPKEHLVLIFCMMKWEDTERISAAYRSLWLPQGKALVWLWVRSWRSHSYLFMEHHFHWKKSWQTMAIQTQVWGRYFLRKWTKDKSLTSGKANYSICWQWKLEFSSGNWKTFTCPLTASQCIISFPLSSVMILMNVSFWMLYNEICLNLYNNVPIFSKLFMHDGIKFLQRVRSIKVH